MQITAIIVSLVLAVVGASLFARAFLQIYGFVRLGQNVPAGSRTNDWKDRTVTVVREFLGHTRMNRWGIVGVAHWFVSSKVSTPTSRPGSPVAAGLRHRGGGVHFGRSRV